MNKSKLKKKESYIKFAKVLRPHGINGTVRVTFLPGGFLNIDKLKKIYFLLSDHYIPYEINKVSGEDETPLISFSNVINISDAKYLQNSYLYAKKEELSKLDINLPIELIGSTIFVKEDLSHLKKVGLLINIIDGPAYDFLEVRVNSGKDILVPFIDEIIVSMNFKRKEIVFYDKAGLFENEF